MVRERSEKQGGIRDKKDMYSQEEGEKRKLSRNFGIKFTTTGLKK